ncbi:hypothetical protein UP10_09095 [Bradyrhizobium sp. LTSPM299]|uniref:hypothetical protein n=1 Tax=Bradyrhizobium sp. LTSPM299 TaxID=1619233 RepID=UPI0005C9617E|nr:hypothetical protein [Bradyrhizobium sp. LTSPM299]KJC61057.1 hypothetical protein UP10_09095 [Bradyrhizobium sp. LTSPM299]
MLPGLRFLFAAIVLATSILVFGLGAAALLRAAHEEFASIPARPAPREPQFAQQTEAPPVLAMLRVDPPSADKVTAENPAPPMSATSEPAAPAEVSPATVPETIATLTADDLTPPVAPKSETQATETTQPAPATEAAPQPPVVDALATQQAAPKLAAVADAPAPASEPASVAAPPSPEAIAAATKIATLRGPEVAVAQPAAAKTPEQSAPSKPAHRKARRHARRTRQVVVQQQAIDPFGQTTTITTVQRR